MGVGRTLAGGIVKGARSFKKGASKVAKKKVFSRGYSRQYFPTARKNIGSPGYSRRTATVAGVGAAAVGTTSFLTAGGDYGFILFIVGLFKFALDIGARNFNVTMIVATILMFYSAIFIFKSRGIITVSLFFVWYIGFGGITDINSIRVFILPLSIIGILVHWIFKKFKNTSSSSFFDSVREELSGSIFPILLFFMDLGIVNFLDGTFGISLPQSVQNLINFTPWWAFLGLSTTKKENFMITGARFFMIVYIIIVIFGTVVPTAYSDFGGDRLPGPEEIFGSNLDQPVKPENPILIQLKCLPRLNDFNLCVTEEQLLSKARANCKNKGVTEKSSGWQECIEEEVKNLKKKPSTGTVDKDFQEYLKVEFAKIDQKKFPHYTLEPQKNYPTSLLIENPNNQPIVVDVSCVFKKGSKTINGDVLMNGQSVKSYPTSKSRESLKILCKPSEKLKGRYSFTMDATLLDVVTESTLKRAFVKNDLDREKWEKEIKSSQFSGLNSDVAKSPAEFARLNFGFGNIESDPIIVADQPVSFESSVENIGKGKISKVKSYVFSSLINKGFTSSDQSCLRGENVNTGGKTKTYHLESCFIELPSEFRQFDKPFEVETFTAKLVYDYKLTQKTSIEVAEQTVEGETS